MDIITFSDSFFKSQSEAAALNSIVNSFRRFCGLYYNEFQLEISDKCKDLENFDGICISVGENRVILDYIPYEEEGVDISKVAGKILIALSGLDGRLAESIKLFLNNRLWELEILFLFCEENFCEKTISCNYTAVSSWCSRSLSDKNTV